MRYKKSNRIVDHDKAEFAFGHNVKVVDTESRTRLINTLTAFLQFTDEQFAFKAEILDFHEYESLEI